MANSLNTNPIYLDTFTVAIDLSTQYPRGIYLHSIEWVNPAAVDDTCTIAVKAGGAVSVNIIEWTCHDVNHPYIKYFDGADLGPLYIAASGVESGSLIIIIH